MFDERDTSRIDSLATGARMIRFMTILCEIVRKRVAREAQQRYPLSTQNHTQLALRSFRRTKDERRVTAHAPVNPIGYRYESKTIQLRSYWSSWSTVVFPFDIAKTCGFRGNARLIVQTRRQKNQLAHRLLMSCQKAIRLYHASQARANAQSIEETEREMSLGEKIEQHSWY